VPLHLEVRQLATTALVAFLTGRDLDARRALDEARRRAAGLGLTDRAALAQFLEAAADTGRLLSTVDRP
jgi:hypothetical protein